MPKTLQLQLKKNCRNKHERDKMDKKCQENIVDFRVNEND